MITINQILPFLCALLPFIGLSVAVLLEKKTPRSFNKAIYWGMLGLCWLVFGVLPLSAILGLAACLFAFLTSVVSLCGMLILFHSDFVRIEEGSIIVDTTLVENDLQASIAETLTSRANLNLCKICWGTLGEIFYYCLINTVIAVFEIVSRVVNIMFVGAKPSGEDKFDKPIGVYLKKRLIIPISPLFWILLIGSIVQNSYPLAFLTGFVLVMLYFIADKYHEKEVESTTAKETAETVKKPSQFKIKSSLFLSSLKNKACPVLKVVTISDEEGDLDASYFIN